MSSTCPRIRTGFYPNGGVRLEAYEPNEPTRTRTLSLDLAPIGFLPSDGCFFLRNTEEHADLIDPLLSSAVIGLTGREVQTFPFADPVREARLAA